MYKILLDMKHNFKQPWNDIFLVITLVTWPEFVD